MQEGPEGLSSNPQYRLGHQCYHLVPVSVCDHLHGHLQRPEAQNTHVACSGSRSELVAKWRHTPGIPDPTCHAFSLCPTLIEGSVGEGGGVPAKRGTGRAGPGRRSWGGPPVAFEVLECIPISGWKHALNSENSELKIQISELLRVVIRK